MKRLAYNIAIREALTEAMEESEDVFLMGEDVAEYGGCFGVSRGMLKKFGKERIINTPISENGFVGVGIGAAIMGLRPIVEIMFMDFLTCCMDQIVNHAAKFNYVYNGQVKVPIVIRTASGGGKGYGATHSQNLESWFLNVPGLKIVAPAFPQDVKGLLKTAIFDDNPILFIENKMLYSFIDEVDEKNEGIPLGKGKIVRSGKDVTIVSYSRMVHESLEAANILMQNGIDAEVLDLRTLFPFDKDMIVKSIEKTGKLIVVEEGVKKWGVGSEIVASIVESHMSLLNNPPLRIGLDDIVIPCAWHLEKEVLPNSENIASRIVNAFYKNKVLRNGFMQEAIVISFEKDKVD